VNATKSYVSEASPYAWTMILGILFIAVVVFLPEGIIGLLRRLVDRFWPDRDRQAQLAKLV
jgi:urea transport system permease protein